MRSCQTRANDGASAARRLAQQQGMMRPGLWSSPQDLHAVVHWQWWE